MTFSSFQASLAGHLDKPLRFALPNGAMIPAHAHVTEVARIDKRFIDCGGTERNEAYCRLQVWVAGDLDHRLTAGKVAKIIELAAGVLGTGSLEVDVEYEIGFIAQFPLASVSAADGELILHLETRHTACLAEDRCIRPATAPQAIAFKPRNIIK